MTTTEKLHFNRMFDALKKIEKGYLSASKMKKMSEKLWGLGFHEALEMSYQNLQSEASAGTAHIKKVRLTKKENFELMDKSINAAIKHNNGGKH